MIATPQQSLQAAAEAARAAGIKAYRLSDEIEGESREVGKVHAALARAVAHKNQPFEKPCVILSGGETTVTIRPQPAGADKSQRGRGGRAGEFCMGLALALQGQSGVYALAADTDGIDGIEDNAGAFVAPDTLARARARGADEIPVLTNLADDDQAFVRILANVQACLELQRLRHDGLHILEQVFDRCFHLISP
jgi:hydroxypyruvate reductase